MSDLTFAGGGRVRALTVVRRHNARSMRLAIDPRDGAVRLSLPTRAALRPALAWAAGKRDWIEMQLARLPCPLPIAPGIIFEVDGAQVVLDWSPDYSRTPTIAQGRLCIGGPIETLSPRLLRWLRRTALKLLAQETRSLADRYGVAITGVGVGDPRSRWGSCSASGAIRYSWRLILTPTFVRQAIVAHEVAHRIHMNHGRAFHMLVAEMNGGDPTPANSWLRTHGAALHGFGGASD